MLRRLGLLTLSESVLDTTRKSRQVPHASSSLSVTALSFRGPVEASHLLGRISTVSASALLDMERSATTSHAQSVGLVVALSEAGSSLSLKDETYEVRTQEHRKFQPSRLTIEAPGQSGVWICSAVVYRNCVCIHGRDDFEIIWKPSKLLKR